MQTSTYTCFTPYLDCLLIIFLHALHFRPVIIESVSICHPSSTKGVKVCICDAEEYGIPSMSVKSTPKFENRHTQGQNFYMDFMAYFMRGTWPGTGTGGNYITMLPADWSISTSQDPFQCRCHAIVRNPSVACDRRCELYTSSGTTRSRSTPHYKTEPATKAF